MRNNSLIYKTYLFIIFLATVTAAVLRTVACMTALDFETGYFGNKVFISTANYLSVFAVLFALSYFLFSKRDEAIKFKFDSPLNYVFAGTLGAALILFAYHIYSMYKAAKAVKDAKVVIYILLFTAIAAIFASVHFLLAAVYTHRRNTKRADLGLVTVAFLCLYAAYLYFNTKMPINSPAKTVDQMAYISAALFFLFETRISIGREKWRSYTVFGFIAMLVTAYSSVPSVLTYIFKGKLVSDSINESVLTFVLFLFVFARLLMTAALPEDRENTTVSLLKEKALERDSFINPSTEETQDAEEVTEESEEYYELNFEAQEEITEAEMQDEENTGN